MFLRATGAQPDAPGGYQGVEDTTYPGEMESTYLTKRRAVDNCHTATAMCPRS